MGKVIKKAAPILTGGALMGGGGALTGALFSGSGLKDKLFGKKDEGTKDRIIGLDPSLARVVAKARGGQAESASLYRDELKRLKDYDPTKLAQLTQRTKEKQLMGQSRDAEMRAKDMVARRGLGRSAAGLSAMVNAGQDSRDKIAATRAQIPAMVEQARAQRMGQIGQISGGLNSILNAQGARRQVLAGRQGTGKRSGGLANLALAGAGAAIGGMKGGPQGAATGMQMGSSMGNILGGAV